MVSSPVKRVSVAALDGSFGPDRGRRIVVAFIPGKPGLLDRLEIRPMGARRAEVITVLDCYRFALRCRAARQSLERARARKELLAQRPAYQRQAAAERKLLL